MTLSDKIKSQGIDLSSIIEVKDVREFIKQLKNEVGKQYATQTADFMNKIIEKLAGKELTK